ncbi:hypothetical protein PHAVU_008G204000 [Phaseolus vulgaris]|uniref:Uncharacterized protein n=1 Tax=Phaseolus vulgaris TaxID=3885 RepID=V7B6S0_PHAVU|nr:hypothetical protein PHAVU_008G204000g [Phaseolus vulgaris]ESW13524.1 hypothetical protein PHAVU_008G204000g [Phaseolus vulgaris]
MLFSASHEQKILKYLKRNVLKPSKTRKIETKICKKKQRQCLYVDQLLAEINLAGSNNYSSFTPSCPLTIIFCINQNFCSTKNISFAACTLLALGFSLYWVSLTVDDVPMGLPNKPNQAIPLLLSCHHCSVPLY